MDSINQIAKILNTIKDTSDFAAKRKKRQKRIERATDTFDTLVPFRMDFRATEKNNTYISLFFKPPAPSACCGTCYCSVCEQFSNNVTLTLTYGYISGTVNVFVGPDIHNAVQVTDFTELNPDAGTLQLNTTGAFIRVCYIYFAGGCEPLPDVIPPSPNCDSAGNGIFDNFDGRTTSPDSWGVASTESGPFPRTWSLIDGSNCDVYVSDGLGHIVRNATGSGAVRGEVKITGPQDSLAPTWKGSITVSFDSEPTGSGELGTGSISVYIGRNGSNLAELKYIISPVTIDSLGAEPNTGSVLSLTADSGTVRNTGFHAVPGSHEITWIYTPATGNVTMSMDGTSLTATSFTDMVWNSVGIIGQFDPDSLSEPNDGKIQIFLIDNLYLSTKECV